MSSDRPGSRTAIVVGGGIAGLSSCFHLADKGIERVVLIEKGQIGDGSSIRAGGISTMLMANETSIRARGISFDIFERFDRILNGYEFQQAGCIFLCAPEQFEAREKLHETQRRAGARFEVLRRTELESRYPDLTVGESEYGILDLRGGWNEPDSYIPALTAKVRDMGVEMREGETVEEFLVENGQVKGVRTRNAGELRADAVVCTVNAWANSLLATVGQPLPVRNFVHQRFVTSPFDRPPQLPATNDDARQIYYRPTEDDRLLLGTGGADPAQIEPGPDFEMSGLEPTPGSLAFILEAVKDRLPIMQRAQIDDHRVGLISYAIDFQPNIGPVGALPGLYLATNFHSGGFGHHPAAGLFVAEFIVDGQTRIDLTAFSPDRFADFDTEAYLQRAISHDQMEEYWATTSRRPVTKRH